MSAAGYLAPSPVANSGQGTPYTTTTVFSLRRRCKAKVVRRVIHICLSLVARVMRVPLFARWPKTPPAVDLLSFSILCVDPNLPDPGPISTPKPNPKPLRGWRSAGLATRFCVLIWWRFFRKTRAAERLAWINQNNVLQEVFCRNALHLVWSGLTWCVI